jgi:hypothetical protein
MTDFFPVAGAAVAVAGADKLIGNRAYSGMFRHLGWSDGEMRAAAAAEVAGGLLMVPRATRRIGGVLVAAVSAIVLASELRRGDGRLAASRGLVLLAGFFAVARPGRV